MDLERRILVRDLAFGGLALAFAVASWGLPPPDSAGWAVAIVSAVAVLALAFFAEHTDTGDGFIDELGPHVVAGLLFVVALATIIVGVAGFVTADGLFPLVFGAGFATMLYRVTFGIVRPIPAPVLDRERKRVDGT